MKKFLLSSVLFFLLPISAFAAYTPTANDALIISSLTQRINAIIDKKGETNRTTYVKKLTDVKGKIKKNEKYVYIVDTVIKNITPSLSDMPSVLSTYLKEIDPIIPTGTGTTSTTTQTNTVTPTQTVSTSQVSLNWMDIGEYQISRDNIYSETNTSGQGFQVGCADFSNKWDNFYYKELETFIKIAEKNSNSLLLELMKSDFTGLEKYYKDKCKMDLKSITSKITIKANPYDEASLKKVYYNFKNEYVTYLENFYYGRINAGGAVEVYCTGVNEKWTYFHLPRLKVMKKYLLNEGKKDMLELFDDIETKTRKVYKEYCKVNELAS